MRLTRNIYPGLFCSIVILMLTGLPGSCFPTVKTFWQWLGPDKIIHLVMFGTLAFLIPFGFRYECLKNEKTYLNKLLWLSLLLSITYSGATELLQKIPVLHRNCSMYDFLADVIGCVLGVFIFKSFIKKKLKKINSD